MGKGISLKYPMEMSVFVIYGTMVNVMGFGYIGCGQCDGGEQFLRWLGFIVFLIPPIMLKLMTDGYESRWNMLKCSLFLMALLLVCDTKPFSCYAAETGFKVTAYILLSIIGVTDLC